jgi:hypothetical protein
MAATVTAVGNGDKEMDPYSVREFDLTNLVSDENIDITHGGPTGFKAVKTEFEWRVPPTALCAATPYRVAASDTTTTARVRVVAEGGGDLTGATLRVRFYWYGGKSGGLTAV